MLGVRSVGDVHTKGITGDSGIAPWPEEGLEPALVDGKNNGITGGGYGSVIVCRSPHPGTAHAGHTLSWGRTVRGKDRILR